MEEKGVSSWRRVRAGRFHGLSLKIARSLNRSFAPVKKLNGRITPRRRITEDSATQATPWTAPTTQSFSARVAFPHVAAPRVVGAYRKVSIMRPGEASRPAVKLARTGAAVLPPKTVAKAPVGDQRVRTQSEGAVGSSHVIVTRAPPTGHVRVKVPRSAYLTKPVKREASSIQAYQGRRFASFAPRTGHNAYRTPAEGELQQEGAKVRAAPAQRHKQELTVGWSTAGRHQAEDLRDKMSAIFARENRLPPCGTSGFDSRLSPVWTAMKLSR